MNRIPPTTGEPYLELKAVGKAYGCISALDGLDLVVRKAELLAVVGPSGSGKTTLLRVIAGLETPDSGEILFEGKGAQACPPEKRDVAMVFQDFALYPHLTAGENIAFGLRARRMAAPEASSRVAEVGAALELQEKLQRLPHQLSGGEQQRVAIARALVRHPGLLLMDEPLANLDPQLRAQFRSDLARLRRRLGLTVVYVTHDQAEAMAVGDRVAVMVKGRILQCAEPSQIYDRPTNQFVAGFFGAPAINLLSGRVMNHGDGLTFEVQNTSSEPLRMDLTQHRELLNHLEGREIVVGIRPEHVRLAPGPDAPSGVVHAQVVAAQFAGHEYHVTVSWGTASSLIARVSTSAACIPAVGERVSVAVEAEKALLFDREGNALRR